MLIPLGTDRPLRRPTRINHALIGANIGMFLTGVVLQRVAPGSAGSLQDAFAFDPARLTPWAFVTYQFLHGGFLHLLLNMVVLYVFGPNVEDRFGRLGYLAFYLAGGAAGAGLHALFESATMIGASGSIAAVTGAYLVLFPRTHIKTLLFFFFIGVFEIPATWFIGFAIAKDIVYQGLGAQGGVALLAHIGGYAFGIGVSLALLATGALPREGFDLFSIGRHAQRRRMFKEITSRSAGPWTAGAGRSDGRARRAEAAEAKPALDPRLQEARAEVSRCLASGRPEEAADVYQRMVGEFGPVTLGARAQLDVANALFQRQDHRAAAAAYSLFLERYERDGEAPGVRLMLGLVCARYLSEPDRARQLLEQAREGSKDEEQRRLAEAVLAEIGAAAH